MATVIEPNPAAPAAEAPVKAGRKSKPPYPGLEENGTLKLEQIPDDYDPKVHAALKEDNFHEDHLDVFYELKAADYRQKADEWADKAKTFKQLGAIGDRKTAAKLASNMASMRNQLEKLAAQGADLSQFGDLAKILGVESAEGE